MLREVFLPLTKGCGCYQREKGRCGIVCALPFLVAMAMVHGKNVGMLQLELYTWKIAVTPCLLPVGASLSRAVYVASLPILALFCLSSLLFCLLPMSLCPCFHSSQANDQYPGGRGNGILSPFILCWTFLCLNETLQEFGCRSGRKFFKENNKQDKQSSIYLITPKIYI